jgi:hypothetical protein
MHYIIYKITNKLNNKFYVGAHKTSNINDDYFGSGVILERAVKKHGIENFNKEILFECLDVEEMWQKETSIVDEEFIARSDTYNVKLGGCGGFDYVNKNHPRMASKDYKDMIKKWQTIGKTTVQYMMKTDEKFKKEMLEKWANNLKFARMANPMGFYGRKHSDESKTKIGKSVRGKYTGKNNPNYGNHWITDGINNKLVKKGIIPVGWRKGRV